MDANGVKAALKTIGKHYGYRCNSEFKLEDGGKVDYVWSINAPRRKDREDTSAIFRETALPIVGFEINTRFAEVSNRKRLLGDVKNLELLSPSLGVLVVPALSELTSQAQNHRDWQVWLKNQGSLERYYHRFEREYSAQRIEVVDWDKIKDLLAKVLTFRA
jgi:hypothetical protein